MADTAEKGTTTKGQGRSAKIAEKVTFGVNSKQAQYARLVVFNYAIADAKALSITVDKEWDVNSVPDAILEKAGKALVNSNLLVGKDGLTYLQKLTKVGSTTGRELTPAYAAEVRPFVRRLELADGFGRRSSERKPKAEGTAKAPAKKTRARKAPAKEAVAA